MVNDVGYGHFWLCIILFEVPYLLSIFPLKTWERAPPIFYRISPWDGVEYHRFFFFKSLHACGRDRDEKLRGWLHPPHLRQNEGHYNDLTNRKLRMKSLWHLGQGYVRVGTIPYFSFISGISCQY